MIKTVRKEEMHLLIDLIPKYYNHCVENPDTLLTRFYGVHRIKPISGPQVGCPYKVAPSSNPSVHEALPYFIFSFMLNISKS